MKIAILGYGKMGKVIENIAINRDHKVVAKIDRDNASNIEELLRSSEADVAIEFSTPETAVTNIQVCSALKIPVVVGTTGWYDQYEDVVKDVKSDNSGLLAATNFSIGVNIFLEINAKLAALMSNQEQYSTTVEETHHIHKLDAPSGTAITIADGIIANSKLENWYLNEGEKKQGLPITALRKDEVPGTHIVRYASDVDAIEIKHEAYNRNGFALGAVLAAEFMNKNKVGIFTMKDVLNIN